MPKSNFLSDRAKALQPSLTLEISAKAKALQNEGRDICSLSAGEPDFNTPSFIVEATQKALADGFTRYGPAAGDPELREAIAQKLNKVNKIKVLPEEVLVTNGGKQAIFNFLQVTLNPGDEVIIQAPYWLSYPEMVKLTGADATILKSKPEEDFALDIDNLKNSIGPSTRLIIINSPGNPTGRLISISEMEALAEILRKQPNILILSDEIYEFLLAEGEIHHSFASIAPDINERIFTVNGFAKGWAMTGWRLGYLAGHKDVIKAATALQSQSTSNVCSFAQRGAIAALSGYEDCLKEMSEIYSNRRKLLTHGLKNIKGIKLVEPQGAFYAFPQLPPNSQDSVTFCKIALEEVGLAMVPGAAFGEDKCVRVSCAVSTEVITDGLQRLERLIDNF